MVSSNIFQLLSELDHHSPVDGFDILSITIPQGSQIRYNIFQQELFTHSSSHSSKKAHRSDLLVCGGLVSMSFI